MKPLIKHIRSAGGHDDDEYENKIYSFLSSDVIDDINIVRENMIMLLLDIEYIIGYSTWCVEEMGDRI